MKYHAYFIGGKADGTKNVMDEGNRFAIVDYGNERVFYELVAQREVDGEERLIYFYHDHQIIAPE